MVLITLGDPVNSLQEEIGRLFDEHHASVLKTAWRVTGNANDAEDVLQTVFLRLMRRDGSQPPPINTQAYLHRAAVNAALDIVRARRGDVPLGADAAPELLTQRPAGEEAQDVQNVLRRTVASLAPPAPEVLALRFFEGYSNKEISRMLGITAVQVAVVVHRGRAKLEQAIRSYRGVTP